MTLLAQPFLSPHHHGFCSSPYIVGCLPSSVTLGSKLWPTWLMGHLLAWGKLGLHRCMWLWTCFPAPLLLLQEQSPVSHSCEEDERQMEQPRPTANLEPPSQDQQMHEKWVKDVDHVLQWVRIPKFTSGGTQVHVYVNLVSKPSQRHEPQTSVLLALKCI